MVSSTASESGPRSFHVVTQSADTWKTACTGNLHALGAAFPFETQFANYGMAINTVTGAVTHHHTGQASLSVVVSPRGGFIEKSFEPTELFKASNVEQLFEQLSATYAGLSRTEILPTRIISLRAADPPAALFNSTDLMLGAPRLVHRKFSDAVVLAGEEWFEDGVESKFSQTLSNLLHAYGNMAVAAAERFLVTPSSNIEIAVEAARWLGNVDDAASQRYRRTILEKLLTASSSRLRHGAAMGLGAMDDPASLPALTRARERETNRRLQHYLQLVVEQLERTRACRSS